MAKQKMGGEGSHADSAAVCFLKSWLNRILVSLLSLFYPWRPLDLKPKLKGFCGQSWEFQGLKRHTINKYLNLQLFLAQRHFDKAFLWNVNLQHMHAEKMWAQVTSELQTPCGGLKTGGSLLPVQKEDAAVSRHRVVQHEPLTSLIQTFLWCSQGPDHCDKLPWPKATWEGNGLFSAYSLLSISREVGARSQSRSWSQAREGRCLLICSSWLLKSAF